MSHSEVVKTPCDVNKDILGNLDNYIPIAIRVKLHSRVLKFTLVSFSYLHRLREVSNSVKVFIGSYHEYTAGFIDYLLYGVVSSHLTPGKSWSVQDRTVDFSRYIRIYSLFFGGASSVILR